MKDTQVLQLNNHKQKIYNHISVTTKYNHN